MRHLFILFGCSKKDSGIPYFIVENLQELFKLKSQFNFDDQDFNSAVNIFHTHSNIFTLCVYDKEFSATIDVSKYDFINII